MEIALIIAVVIFVALAGSVGIQRAVTFIPALIILAVLFMFFGYVVVTFFPFILIYIVFLMLRNKKIRMQELELTIIKQGMLKILRNFSGNILQEARAEDIIKTAVIITGAVQDIKILLRTKANTTQF